MKLKIYEPVSIRLPGGAVVVEEEDGHRWLVLRHWNDRVPYHGYVRPDPIKSTLRIIAWCFGIPGSRDETLCEIPERGDR